MTDVQDVTAFRDLPLLPAVRFDLPVQLTSTRRSPSLSPSPPSSSDVDESFQELPAGGCIDVPSTLSDQFLGRLAAPPQSSGLRDLAQRASTLIPPRSSLPGSQEQPPAVAETPPAMIRFKHAQAREAEQSGLSYMPTVSGTVLEDLWHCPASQRSGQPKAPAVEAGSSKVGALLPSPIKTEDDVNGIASAQSAPASASSSRVSLSVPSTRLSALFEEDESKPTFSSPGSTVIDRSSDSATSLSPFSPVDGQQQRPRKRRRASPFVPPPPPIRSLLGQSLIQDKPRLASPFVLHLENKPKKIKREEE